MTAEFQPFDYQEIMRSWMRERKVGAYFCSPGLGKTVVTLDWLDWLFTTGRSRGALIVAPLRVGLITWPNQVARWNFCSWMQVADLRTPQGQEAWFKGEANIYICNFEMLASREVMLKCKPCDGKGCDACEQKGSKVRKDFGLVHKLIKALHRKKKPLPVDTLIVDELSIAKSHNSKRINALRAYNDHFTYRLGLTGTPVCNSYLDLFSQIRLLDNGERFGTVFGQFREDYFEKSDYHGYKWQAKLGSKEEIDRKISDLALVMLSSDYLDLPTTSTEDVMVPIPMAALKAYKILEKEMLVELETGEVTAFSAAALCTKLLQFTGGASYDENKEVHFVHDAKLKALKDLRKKHGKEPMLVLTAYKHENARVLEAIPGARMFNEKDLGEWQKGKIHTWVANPASLSHGIDGLQKGGRIAVWYTQTYSNEKFLQTNARLIRTGQTAETIIYRLLVPKSIDEAVAEALRRKDDEQTGCLEALKALQKLTS